MSSYDRINLRAYAISRYSGMEERAHEDQLNDRSRPIIGSNAAEKVGQSAMQNACLPENNIVTRLGMQRQPVFLMKRITIAQANIRDVSSLQALGLECRWRLYRGSQ